ncbi:MAG: transposase [Bdellovibrionota bacterium]
MAYPLRTEHPDEIYHITTRTIGSRLWFINNKSLEYLILGYLAKFSVQFNVTLYAFTLMGNHYHIMAKFPDQNKAAFMKAFNSIIARLVKSKVKQFEDGRLWSRRYADQVVLKDESIEHWMLYCGLNPIISGVCKTLGEYEGYNSFNDAVSGRVREFRLFNRAKYLQESRWKKDIRKQDYIETYTLSYERLVSYDDLSQSEYKRLMWEHLEDRRSFEIEKRVQEGKGFMTQEARKNIKPGTKPKTTKTTDRYGFTPFVLCLCKKTKYEYLEQYFLMVARHREASEKYRAGDYTVEFPPGTYRPPAFCA